jgi:hypothetical protein
MNAWTEFSTVAPYTPPPPPAFCGSRGVFGGGNNSAAADPVSNEIDYITISNNGNSTNFGELLIKNQLLSACSNGSRGLFGGGHNESAVMNNISYITFSNTTNAIDFGDLSLTRYCLTSCSNETIGLFVGGVTTSLIDYVSIANLGNAVDFGGLIGYRYYHSSCSGKTRFLSGAGEGGYRTLEYGEFSTQGVCLSFGELINVGHDYTSSTSNNTRGLFASGSYGANNIDYITFNTLSNSSLFGQLIADSGWSGSGSCSDGTRAVFTRYLNSGSTPYPGLIDYVIIDTAGNASEFGTFGGTASRYLMGACSGN